MAKNPNRSVLESGEVTFWIRPRVQHEYVHSINDVQRFYLILNPKHPIIASNAPPHESKVRLIIIGKKKMPGFDHHEKGWGYVADVVENFEDLSNELHSYHYSTSTRGERTVGDARLIGEGHYEIVKVNRDVFFGYIIEVPEKLGEVQSEFNLSQEGVLHIFVKNPTQPSGRNIGLSGNQKAHFPDQLQKLFLGRRFIQLEIPEFLNFKGTELLLIASNMDLKAKLLESGEELENFASGSDHSKFVEDFYSSLNFEDDPHLEELRGSWE